MLDARELVARDRREDCPYPCADDPAVLQPILDELDADDDLRRLAGEIATIAESVMWVVGKRRSTVAATAVYLAGAKLGDTKPVFSQADVAAAGDVAKTSIINYHEDLTALYEAAHAPPPGCRPRQP